MKALLGTAIVLAGLWLVFWYLPANGVHKEIGKGEHTGFITAVEKTGLFYKTGTAYIKTDVSSSQEESYCVVSEEVYQKLSDASKSGAKITVQYVDWFIKGFKHCNAEGAVIVGVK